MGTPQSWSDSPATASLWELEGAVRPRQGFTKVPKALSNDPGCNDSNASSRFPQGFLIQHPCPLGEGQSAISQESRGSLRKAVSAKALNLEDFSRQTFPGSGREAGLDRLRVRLSRLPEVGSRPHHDLYSKMRHFRSGWSRRLPAFRRIFFLNWTSFNIHMRSSSLPQ